MIEAVSTVDPSRTPERPFKYVDVSSVSNTTFEIEEVQELLGRDAPSRARRHIQRGDVIFATIRPTLKRIAVVPEHLHGEVCSTGYFVFRTKPFLNERYLFYYLMTPGFMSEMEKLQTGASYPAVNDAQVKSQFIQFPPLTEQKRIVAILDEAFEGIAKATANAERNLANARELFNSTLDQRFLSAPAYWHRRSLGTVCTFSGGSQPPKSEFSKVAKSGYVRLIQIRDYKSDDHIVFVDKNSVSKFCDASDVMIGRYGPPLFQILRGIEGAYNVALMKATPNESVLSKDYLYYFLKNSQILNHIIQRSDRAAGQTGIKREVLEAYEICFPELEEQAEIVREFGELEQQSRGLAACYETKLRQLSAFKQALLHKAFSGQLTGKEAIAA